MIAQFSKALNVVSLSVAELKPGLDPTKNNSVGEFLANSFFLYAQALLKK
jgi:hypothetical protein